MLYCINAVILGILCVLWKRSDWGNALVKVILFGATIANVALYVKGL